jgi:putative DNA primase/helicase
MSAEALARALSGKRAGRQWVCRCALPQNHRHGDRNPSLLIYDGDIAPLLKCMAGCDTREIIAELRRRGLWKQTGPITNHHLPIIQHPSSDDAVQKQIIRARRLWDGAQDPRGTLAERYLVEARALSLPHELVNRVLRFHPECPFGDQRAPALLAAFRPIQGDLHPDAPPVAIQRLRLDPRSARKIGKAMSLGPISGAAIKLDPDEAVTTALGVGEGFETCLSLYVAGWHPMWVLGHSGAIARLPVLGGLEVLTIFADHDENGVGESEALKCKARYEAAGIQVDLCLPDQEGDWNDCWLHYSGRPT